MPFVRIAAPTELPAVLDRLAAKRVSALLLFFGSEDPQTGTSWCPDCVTADPVLRRAIAERRPDLTCYECPVGARSDWKQRSEHPYRLHPVTRVARIPTLILLEGNIERGRLVEADCANPALVQAFLTTPAAQGVDR